MRVIAGEKGGRRLVAPEGQRTRPTSDRVREAAFSILESFLVEEGSGLQGAAVWDLFAGSGALGIEALSRGAAQATFVDSARSAVSAMRANLARLGYGTARARVIQADVLRWAHGLDATDGPVPGSPGEPTGTDPPLPSAASFSATGGRMLDEQASGEQGKPVARDGESWSSPAETEVDVVLADPPYEWCSWAALLAALAALGPLVVMETALEPELPVGWHVVKARRYGGTLVTLTRFDATTDGHGLRGPGGPART